jgi:hypothetical protein
MEDSYRRMAAHRAGFQWELNISYDPDFDGYFLDMIAVVIVTSFRQGYFARNFGMSSML